MGNYLLGVTVFPAILKTLSDLELLELQRQSVWHFFERPAKLARGGPAPWSTRMLNPGEETCSVLVY